MLIEDDLYDLLIAGEHVAQGRYNHTTWSIQSNGSLASTDAQVASIHESMHYVLNNTTLFGLMLIVAAHLAREKSSHQAQLKALVNNCRLTHETFATFSGLLLVSPEIASAEWLVDKYDHAYIGYVETAEAIIAGVNEPHLQLVILNAVCRLCMQSKGLIEGIQNKTPFDVKPTDFPDRRFRYLLERLDHQYWKDVIEGYRRANSSDEKIQEYLRIAGSQWLEDHHGSEILDQVTADLQTYIYTKLQHDFMHGQYESIDDNDHLIYNELLIQYANATVPGKFTITPLRADPNPSEDFGLSEYQNESITIRETPLSARVSRLSDVEENDWGTLQSDYNGFKHFYITSRVTEKLLNQFIFDQADQDCLLSNYPDFVVAVFYKKRINGEMVMLVYVLDEPAQIAEISKRRFTILSNSSMILLADHRWDEWYDALQQYSTQTILFDLRPSSQLNLLSQQYEVLEFHKFRLRRNRNVYSFVCLVARGKIPTGIYFMPVTDVMANILVHYLNGKDYGQQYHEDAEGNEGYNVIINYGMDHLVDETVFDFQSEHTDYANRGFASQSLSIGTES